MVSKSLSACFFPCVFGMGFGCRVEERVRERECLFIIGGNEQNQDDITKRRGELRGAVEQIGEAIYDILTSPRLWKAIIKILIVSVFAVTAYNLSVLAYAAFYHFHLPDQIVTVPVHLQYG